LTTDRRPTDLLFPKNFEWRDISATGHPIQFKFGSLGMVFGDGQFNSVI